MLYGIAVFGRFRQREKPISRLDLEGLISYISNVFLIPIKKYNLQGF